VLKDIHRRLNIKHDSDTLKAARRGFLADDDEVNSFEDDEVGGPTLNPLKPFWPAPKCPWNLALGELFVSDLITQHPQHEPNKGELVEIFIQRLKIMKGCIRDQVAKPGETAEATDLHVKEELGIVNRAKRIQGRQRTVSFSYTGHVYCLTPMLAL